MVVAGIGKRELPAVLLLLLLAAAVPALGLQGDPKKSGEQASPGGLDGNRSRLSRASEHPPTQPALDSSNSNSSAVLADETGRRNVLTGPPGGDSAFSSADLRTYRELAEAYARSGSLPEAAASLEAAAARAGSEAPALYREAAELRERAGEYGQALLDYRAAMDVSGASKRDDFTPLTRHLRYLSLSLAGDESPLQLTPGTETGTAEKSPGPGQRNTDRASDGLEHTAAGLSVPGGVQMLAAVAGIEEALMRDEDALARLLSAIQESGPIRSRKYEDNPLRRALIENIRSYEGLLRHMLKKNLLPEGFDRARWQKLIFPFAGDKTTLKRTSRFLSFFGVKFKYSETKDGQISIELTLSESSKFQPRRRLMRYMGIDLQDRRLREVTVNLGDDEIPIMYGAETWKRDILRDSKKKSRPLLESLLLSPKAMILYLALSSASEGARAALASSMPPARLLTMSDTLAVFARYLDFRKGNLVFPGSDRAWQALLGGDRAGSEGSLVSLLTLDNGRAAALYAGLALAPREVQEYFTASPERLHQTYEALSALDTPRSAGSDAGMGKQNLGRLLRQLTVTPGGLALDLDSRFRSHLIPGSKQESAQKGTSQIRLEPQDIAQLAKPGDADLQAYSPVEVLEFVCHLYRRNPDAWDRNTIDALMMDSSASPVMMDIIGDIDPEADLLTRYIAYCRQLIGRQNQKWNVDRTRTSQALFYLLSLLRREGSLSAEKAGTLLAGALRRMDSEDEAEFAMGVAGFLSEELMPALVGAGAAVADRGDPVLRALAGNGPRREFSFEGRSLALDTAARRMDRMREGVMQQRFTPLTTLLAIYRRLDELSSERDDAGDLRTELATMLGGVQSAQITPGTSKSQRQSMAWTDVEGLKNKLLLGPSDKSGTAAGLRQTARELAASLHAELGVTLLTYCYAYHGSPEVDALAFDVNFVRKHDFTENGPRKLPWATARLENKSELGTYLSGSVSGIDYELARLEVAQSHSTMSGRESTLMPTLLVGLRAIPPALRSDRAQEFVALAARLGREVFVLATLHPELMRWCDDALGSLLPPQRHEKVISLLERSRPSAATVAVTPSEFFFLGEAYLEARGREGTAVGNEVQLVDTSDGQISSEGGFNSTPDTAFASPSLVRLEEIRRRAQETDAAVFKKELEQYGMSLRRRLAMRRFTLDLPEPYEYLEQNLREQLLFERMCDLKVQLAELHYALGLPAFVAEADGEPALREILSRPSDVGAGDWRHTLQRTARLRKHHVRAWIEEALNRGTLTLVEDNQVDRRGPTIATERY